MNLAAISMPMTRRYWASLGKRQIGPFETLEAAIAAGQTEFAKTLARKPREQFTTGYGAYGPHFDMRFHRGQDN